MIVLILSAGFFICITVSYCVRRWNIRRNTPINTSAEIVIIPSTTVDTSIATIDYNTEYNTDYTTVQSINEPTVCTRSVEAVEVNPGTIGYPLAEVLQDEYEPFGYSNTATFRRSRPH